METGQVIMYLAQALIGVTIWGYRRELQHLREVLEVKLDFHSRRLESLETKKEP